jgi:hypothetical protein
MPASAEDAVEWLGVLFQRFRILPQHLAFAPANPRPMECVL